MKTHELGQELIRYGEVTYDKEYPNFNTRVQHFIYNNKSYEVVRKNGEFIVIRLLADNEKQEKQLKLIQEYLLKEVAPKILDELYTLNMDSGIYDFAEMVDYVIRNKVVEDTTYQLLDNLQ